MTTTDNRQQVATPPADPKNNKPQNAPSAESFSQKTSEEIWKLYSTSTNRREFLDKVLKVLSSYFDSPYAVLSIEAASGVQQSVYETSEQATNAWRKRCDGPLLEAQYRQLASARLSVDAGSNRTFAILSCPVVIGNDGTNGAVAIVGPCLDRNDASGRLQSLQTFISLICSMAVDVGSQAAKAAAPKSVDAAAASRAAGYQSLNEFSFAIANNLKAKLGCESVSFGIVRSSKVKLLCMSGVSNVDAKSLGTQQLEQVMEECLDANTICCYQATKGGVEESTGHLLHRGWSSDSAGSAVASIPLTVEDRIVAILSLRHVPNQTFTRDQLEKVRELAAPLMPGALLLDKADRKLSEHAINDVKQWAKENLTTDTWARRIVFGCLVAFASIVILGKQTYLLSVPCALAPSQEVHIAAPFEGVIKEVFVRPGDFVQAGQVLVRMDTRQLKLDFQKAEADFASAKIDMLQGATSSDHNRSALAKAKMDAAQSQLNKISRHLENAEIKAPSNGTILSGDLSTRIGEAVPIGTPLMQFASADQWKIVIDVPEYASSLVQQGQTGTFAAFARPGTTLPCSMSHVRATAEVRQGKNVFVAEASLEQAPPEWIRSGMDGVARVDVGRHPILWVWMHRVIDSVRVYLWKI